MNTQGVETLKAAARRSVWLILGLVVLGVLAMNVMRQSQGDLYQASSRVVLSPTDLSQLFSGSSAYVDPQLVDQTETALANAPGLFSRAADDAGGRLGSGSALESATSVSKNGTTISFTATASTSARAAAIATAVAKAYPGWRAQVASASVQKAIDQIQGELKVSGETRADLLAQLNRLRVLKTLTSGNVLLVETAHGPRKVRPNPLRDSLIGAFVGLFVALVLSAIREAADTRVRSEEEIEEVLEVPVLGSVESLPRRTTLLAGGGATGERYGDMYGLLAANIAQEAQSKPALIAVTSATASEGKTTTASNLAAAFARRSANVLLLDMDTRKPAIARVFGIPQEAPGLEQALQQRWSIDALAWRVSLNGAGAPLSPPTGPNPLSDATMENGKPVDGSLAVIPLRGSIKGGIAAHMERVQALLASIGQRYDYVVIDTPPALALPDVTELTKLVDEVVVVVRHGQVTRRNLSALNRLHRSWPDVRKNAVLVGVPRQQANSYYE